MSYMRMGALALSAGLLLAGCVPSSGYVLNPWNPWGVPANTPQPVSYSEVYKYQGSRQCEGGGIALEDMQRQLQASGVEVNGSTCGMDGRMYPAFCGGADGKINIFRINSNGLNSAFAQGFSLFSDLPGAQRTGCYANNNAGNTGSSTTNSGSSTTYPYSGTSGDNSYYSYRLKR